MPSMQMSVEEHVEQAPLCNALRPSASITFKPGSIILAQAGNTWYLVQPSPRIASVRSASLKFENVKIGQGAAFVSCLVVKCLPRVGSTRGRPWERC